MAEGILAFIGSCTLGVGFGLGLYEFVLRPLDRHLAKHAKP